MLLAASSVGKGWRSSCRIMAANWRERWGGARLEVVEGRCVLNARAYE